MIDISFDEYLLRKEVSNSSLGYLLECPYLYQKYVLEKRMKEQTAAQVIGTATHCAVFEADRFKQEYIRSIDVKRNTTVGKAAFAEFQEANDGKIILKPDDYDEVVAMAYAVRESVPHLLDDIACEQSIFWLDDDSQIYCKARIDAVAMDRLLDLKTTKSVKPEDFTRSIVQYGYYRQAAFYLDGYNKATDNNFTSFTFICVQKDYPYLTCVYELDEASIQFGRNQYKEALKVLARCRDSGYYPSYPKDVQTLHLPDWLMRSQIEDIKIGE